MTLYAVFLAVIFCEQVQSCRPLHGAGFVLYVARACPVKAGRKVNRVNIPGAGRVFLLLDFGRGAYGVHLLLVRTGVVCVSRARAYPACSVHSLKSGKYDATIIKLCSAAWLSPRVVGCM